jgi:hypothetical protein
MAVKPSHRRYFGYKQRGDRRSESPLTGLPGRLANCSGKPLNPIGKPLKALE